MRYGPALDVSVGGLRCHLPTAKVLYPASRRMAGRKAWSGPAMPWYPGNPIDSSTSAPTPTAWWLRPLRRQARVGEHSGVAWKFV